MRDLPLLLLGLALAVYPAQAARSLKGVATGASLPSQQCLSSWNAAVAATGPCGTAATLQSCCPALKALGLSCVEELMGAMAADPAYATTLDTFNKTLESCAAAAGSSGGGSGSGGSGSAAATAQCLGEFSDTLQNSCLSSFSTCCPAVEKLGTECLQAVMDMFADDATTQATLIQLLQACGWDVQGGGARSAAAADTSGSPRMAAQSAAVEADSNVSLLTQLQHARCPLCCSKGAALKAGAEVQPALGQIEFHA